MGLTPMYNKTILIVEPLRQGKLDNVETNFKELMHDLAVLKNILNDAQGVK
jgi:predicted aldo/keto reductase-like oxidoreductase